MGVILIIAGCAAIAGGIFGKEFFVSGADGVSSFDRRSSTASGRAVFLIGGVFLIVVGTKLLLQ